MIVLVVGPSGVGKSKSVEALATHLPGVRVEHLDLLAPRWARHFGILAENEGLQTLRERVQTQNDDPFLLAGLAAIGWLAVQHPGKHVVVDVGAGFLAAPLARSLHNLY